MELLDAVYRSGLSARAKLTQAGQDSQYAPFGDSEVKTFSEADVIYGVKAVGTTVSDTISLALHTGVLTGPAGSPTLTDADGKTVNGDTITMLTYYCHWLRIWSAAGVLKHDALVVKPVGAAASGVTVTGALSVVGDYAEILVLGKAAAP